ncbi:MAG: HAMP domain-containing protein, partial [Bacteroidota bacterium]
MKLTLRTKLIMLSTLLVTIIMGNVTYFFTIRELHSKREAVELQIERIARNIATMQLLDRQDWSVYQNYISQLMAFNDDIIYIGIYDDRQSLRAHTLNLGHLDIDRNRPLTRRVQADIVRRLDRGAIADESREDLRTHTVNIRFGDRILGSVHVGFSLIEINRDLRQGIVRNVVIAVVFFFIFSFLSTLLSRRLTGPLERLNKAMGAIAGGDLEQRVEVESGDEIGQLAQTFNVMVKGLRERRIIESLGHELSATFQLERLARLVRDRLSGAIGAARARLYLCQRDKVDLFCEVISRDENGQPSDPIRLDEQAKSYLLQGSGAFMLEAA